MSIYRLSDVPVFPPVSESEPDGLLAVGGDLSPDRLIAAYQSGIFPWFEEDDQLLWWAPDPRCILSPARFKVSRNLRRRLRSTQVHVSADTAFERVIRTCREIRRKGEQGTWITEGMQDAYVSLHQRGLAHSVETWEGDTLIGGLYGVSLGSAFFGESMFSFRPDASKVAFAHLARTLNDHDFSLIDCQMHTPHLESLGATAVPRADFMKQLDHALAHDTHATCWSDWFEKPWSSTP